MEEVVATVEKNRREEIRIALREYEGRDLCDVRVFAEPYAGDEWVATKVRRRLATVRALSTKSEIYVRRGRFRDASAPF